MGRIIGTKLSIASLEVLFFIYNLILLFLFLFTLCVFLLVCRLQGMNKCLPVHNNSLKFCYSYISVMAMQNSRVNFPLHILYLETVDRELYQKKRCLIG